MISAAQLSNSRSRACTLPRVVIMSWLLGRFGQQQQSGQSSPPDAGPGAAGEPGGKPLSPPTEEGKKWVGFDPTGLERAAKAARELDASGIV